MDRADPAAVRDAAAIFRAVGARLAPNGIAA